MAAWDLVYTSPYGLSLHAGVLYDNRAVVIGGVSNLAVVSYIAQFRGGRVLENPIVSPTGFPATYLHAASVFDKRVFVSGGSLVQTAVDDVYVSEDLKSWDHIGDLPAAICNHRMVAFGDQKIKLVCLGGFDGINYFHTIYTSSDGKNWTTVNEIGTMWSARIAFGALVYKNKLWVFGGGDDVNDFNDVWWTDDLIHWNRCLEHAPWHERSGFGFCEWDERMWIIGGRHYAAGRQSYTYLRDTWFSRDGRLWEQGFDFPSNLSFTYVAPIDNKIHVFGGLGNETSIYKMNLG